MYIHGMSSVVKRCSISILVFLYDLVLSAAWISLQWKRIYLLLLLYFNLVCCLLCTFGNSLRSECYVMARYLTKPRHHRLSRPWLKGKLKQWIGGRYLLGPCPILKRCKNSLKLRLQIVKGYQTKHVHSQNVEWNLLTSRTTERKISYGKWWFWT